MLVLGRLDLNPLRNVGNGVVDKQFGEEYHMFQHHDQHDLKSDITYDL